MESFCGYYSLLTRDANLVSESCATLLQQLGTVQVIVCAAVHVAVTGALTVARLAGALKTMSGTIAIARDVQLVPAVVTLHVRGTVAHARVVAHCSMRTSSSLYAIVRLREARVPLAM